jgi:hypothetical protein
VPVEGLDDATDRIAPTDSVEKAHLVWLHTTIVPRARAFGNAGMAENAPPTAGLGDPALPSAVRTFERRVILAAAWMIRYGRLVLRPCEVTRV